MPKVAKQKRAAKEPKPSDTTPDFKQLLQIEEQKLAAQLRAVRAAISHRGEKGRGLEHYAMGLVRSFLPAEYGVGTGFVAAAIPRNGGGHHVTLSPQLDLIIYDALRGGPIIDLGPSQVYPLECVVGVVEVKARLYQEVPDICRDSAVVRSLVDRHFLLSGRREKNLLAEHDEVVKAYADGGGNWTTEIRRATLSDLFPPPKAVTEMWEPLRCFAMAFEYGRAFNPTAAQRRVEEAWVPRSHLHAVLVPGTCVLWNENPARDQSRIGKVRVETKDTLGVFRHRLAEALAYFPRPSWTASIDLRPYFGEVPDL